MRLLIATLLGTLGYLLLAVVYSAWRIYVWYRTKRILDSNIVDEP